MLVHVSARSGYDVLLNLVMRVQDCYDNVSLK